MGKKKKPKKPEWKWSKLELSPVPRNVPRVTFEKPAVKPKSEKQDIPKPGKSKGQYDPEKEFLRDFRELTTGKYNDREIFSDFVVMAASSISNAIDHDELHFRKREERYLSLIRKYEPNEQKIFPRLLAHTAMALEENPEQDFLGSIFMRLDFGSDAKGQIFTPYHICELMAGVTMSNVSELVKKQGYFTIDDPCCGAGATLIAGINKARRELEREKLNFQNHILVSGQDIDETVLMMCYIQVSLLGVAGYFKLGNSLTEPMTDGDSLENYWFTPMYFSDVWETRRRVQKALYYLKGGDGENGRKAQRNDG